MIFCGGKHDLLNPVEECIGLVCSSEELCPTNRLLWGAERTDGTNFQPFGIHDSVGICFDRELELYGIVVDDHIRLHRRRISCQFCGCV